MRSLTELRSQVSVHVWWGFSIGITGPYDWRCTAPQRWHVGDGGTTLQITVGTVTGPPHNEHVPITCSLYKAHLTYTARQQTPTRTPCC